VRSGHDIGSGSATIRSNVYIAKCEAKCQLQRLSPGGQLQEWGTTLLHPVEGSDLTAVSIQTTSKIRSLALKRTGRWSRFSRAR